MDLEDWELLPINHDEDHEAAMEIVRDTEKGFDMDYFICPTQEDPVGKTEFHQRSSVVPTKLLQVPITWEPVNNVEDTNHNKNQDPSSPRITFKTAKENEFVDMKMDLPVRLTSPLPQNDEKHSVSGGVFAKEYYDEMGTEVKEGSDLVCTKGVDWDEKENIYGEKMNLWKMSLHGIGAIWSFGVAAAVTTFCVFFIGHNNSIQGCRNKNKILRFQIYADDNKRINEVVKHATKLNEAMSVMKSLPVARARISFGGYYDAL